MKMCERNWKEFFIAGDEGLFHISSTSSGIDKNKLNMESGKIPYLTRSNERNGINLFVTDAQNSKFKVDKGNVITIGLDTQTVFYQPYEFFTGQNIQILKSEKINKNVAMFIISMLKMQIKKFNWGGNGATLGRLCRTKIMLPVNQLGDPDWDFMEKYVIELEKQKKIAALKFIRNQLNSLQYTKIPSLSEKKWKAIPTNKVFSIKSGKRLESYNMIAGTRPFIGATDSGNGITNFVSNTNKSLDKNVLGVNYNGSVVECFFHPYECIFSDDVKRFHLLEYDDNKYVLLFFKAIILQQKNKYMYAYKFNEARMKRQYIMVPINNEGKIDYEYMEQYIKNLMIKKYTNYITHA